MKNLAKLIKTLALFVVLMTMAEGVKGANNLVSTITISQPSPSSVTYGSVTSTKYTLTITPIGGSNKNTVTLTVTGLPLGASYTLSSNPISLPGGNSTTPIPVTLTIDKVKTNIVGSYTLTITENSNTPNKTFTTTSFNHYTIQKKDLIATATTSNKIYNGTTEAILSNIGYTGLITEDIDKVRLIGNFSSKDVGTWPISATISGDAAGNYNLTTTTLTSRNITPATLTYKANAVQKIYGEANPTLSGTVEGFVNGETYSSVFPTSNPTWSTTATATSPVNHYPVTGSGLSATNYIFIQASGNSTALNISQRSLYLTGTKTFDGNASFVPAQIILGNIVNNDGVTLTGGSATVENSAPNNYTTLSYNTLICSNTNYSTSGGTLSFTITPPTAVSWSSTTSTDWGTSGNWTPPYLPTETVDVTIANAHPVIAANTEAACKNLTIESSGGLTINAKGSLTVSGNLDNKAGASGLSLVSEVTSLNAENGTGSLLVQGTTSGSATLTRAMKSGNYHLVTSPLGGQTINDFLTTNATIQTGKDANADYRNMRDYNPTANDWNDFFKVGTSATSGNIIPGKGYSIRIKSTQAHQVVFTGTLPNGDISIQGLTPDKWNCIGNPYTSAITINTLNDPNTGFLQTNLTNLNLAFGSIYVWDPLQPTTGYTVISNASRPYVLQQGQAFMVYAGTNHVDFNRGMQTHAVALELKSTDNIWPTINLVATADSINSSTTIAFHEGMTPGLDVSYDAGLLKAASPIDIYTRLIDDYGIPFAIQALPSDEYDRLIIPVGVDYPKGGEVTFSAKGVYLPAACRPILEDRLTGIKTDLTDQSYTADLSANTAGTGRFYLHTSWSSTGIDSRENNRQLTAWAIGNNEINIKGQINNGAVASLFDLQGRLIATHVMREGVRERFSLPAVKPGIYLLQVRDQQKTEVMKVRFGE